MLPNLIHTRANQLSVTPEVLQRLHGMVQEGAGGAGRWKRIQNEIVEFRPGEPPRIRFLPVPPEQTPAAVEELCLAYRHALDQEHVPSLVAAALVLDFLCVHPFRDGNGRVARLMTLLTCYQHGYEVGRYISLERLVEDSREGYYGALQRSSEGWHEGRHDLLPWLNYSLAILYRACKTFEERAGQVKSPRGAKTALVLSAIQQTTGPFRVADLQRACPGVSVDLIRQVLKHLRSEGGVECLGRGQQAQWRRWTDGN